MLTRSLLPTFQDTRSRRALGIAAMLAGVLVVFLATTRPNPLKQTQAVSARFDSVQGLGRIDRNVRVGGVNVGTIGKVTRDGDDAVVEMKIDPDIPIHADATAALRPHTLFEGSDFIDLSPGSPSAPQLEGPIPRRQTRVYISLDRALRVLRPANRLALRDLIHSSAAMLDRKGVSGIRDLLQAAPQLTKELGPTARALQGPRGTELASAIRGMASTVHAVAAGEQRLLPTVRHANATLAALAVDHGAALDASLDALPGALEELQAGGAQLTALIDRLDRSTANLRPATAQLAPLLVAARPFLRTATAVATRTRPLVRGLRLILAEAAAASTATRQLIRKLDPGARILAESVGPYLISDSPLGAPNYVQLFGAFGAGTGALRQYQTASQQPGGTGHALRAGLYGDANGFLGGLVRPTCATIALLNATVAQNLQAAGACQP